MGDYLRERLLRALRLSSLWGQLDAISARLRRLEQDVVTLQRAAGQRPMTIPASPPPPPKSQGDA